MTWLPIVISVLLCVDFCAHATPDTCFRSVWFTLVEEHSQLATYTQFTI